MMTSKSQSIPIAPSRYHIMEQRCMQEERAAMMQADYEDYLFYRRIVGGIEKTREATQCMKLRDQNQEVIDNLHHTRHAPSSLRTYHHHAKGASPPSRNFGSTPHPRRWDFLPQDDCDEYDFEKYFDEESTKTMPSRSNSFASVDDDETLIFELDL
mmetsp:Transcript_18638/g.46136  ORF Transcript_18638/g.46136 Transcript_18638/m.46136 type:complete len:156 (+) Transcript_18638:104-571(+)